MWLRIGEETFVRSYTDQEIRQLKEEYAAIAELRNPAHGNPAGAGGHDV